MLAPPGKLTAESGILRTESLATAVLSVGMGGSSSGSSTISSVRVPAVFGRRSGPSEEWSESSALDKDAKISFPFFHATTSGEWVVTLRFFVPHGTFRGKSAEKLLDLTPFHQSPTPVLSDSQRVTVNDHGPWQEITITGHVLADFETKGFDTFLTRAVTAFLDPRRTQKPRRADDL